MLHMDIDFFNTIDSDSDFETYSLPHKLDRRFFNKLERESKDQDYKAAFAKVFKKYPGIVIREYRKNFPSYLGSKMDPLPPMLMEYINGNREEVFADLEKKASSLKITSCLRGQRVNNSKQKYSHKKIKKETQEEGKAEEEKKGKYPHRVAAIINVIRDDAPQQVVGDAKEEFDYQKYLVTTPDEKAISIIRKATHALNHPKNYYRLWSRSDNTNAFYNKAIDDLVEVDYVILAHMRENLLEKFTQQAKHKNAFDLGRWGRMGGVDCTFSTDETDYSSKLTARVPHRFRDIFLQLNIALNVQVQPEVKKNALREIAKSAAEALNDGFGSQTISTRGMYYEILQSLVKKESLSVEFKKTF